MSGGQPKPGGPDSPGGAGAAGHTRERVVTRGVAAEDADAAAVLIHGRGGSPEGMLTLADEVPVEGLAWIAPHADGSTWYPTSFLSPLEANEPWLSSALEWLDEIVSDLEGKGVASRNVAFVGFSQGACLSTEFVARNPRRFGGVAALSGGLVGPPESDFRTRFGLEGEAGEAGEEGEEGEEERAPAAPDDRAASLSGTPVFLGCSDVDRHIPEERVHESAEILEALGADVTVRIYPGMGHTVNEDEIERVHALLTELG